MRSGQRANPSGRGCSTKSSSTRDEQPAGAPLGDDVGQSLLGRGLGHVDGQRLVQQRLEFLLVLRADRHDLGQVTSGDTRWPRPSALARSKCSFALSSEPPTDARPPSQVMKKSCSEPISHASSSARARRISASMTFWSTESDESALSIENAAPQAAAVQ